MMMMRDEDGFLFSSLQCVKASIDITSDLYGEENLFESFN